MPPATPKPLSFKKNKSLLSSHAKVTLEATAPQDPATGKALLQNKPFPRVPIQLGKVSVGFTAGEKVSFGSGKGKATFSGKGSVFGGIGVYKSSAAVFKAVKIDKQVVAAAELDDTGGRLFVVLTSGYALSGSGKGSIALAPGFAPKLEASAKRRRAYAVIQTIDPSTGARDAVQGVLDSWRLPRQVGSVDDLDPGTWIIAEVDGAFTMALKAQYGYTFDWVKAAEAHGLSGDIGLNIQLGVAASLGFSASGRYALVIGRDSLRPQDKRLRVRLHRLSQHGWSFAFDASAMVKGDTGKFLPGQYDKFVAAVFGLDPGQLVEDVRRWVDPETSLEELLAGESIDLVHEVLTDLTGIDAAQEFARAQATLKGLLDRWDALPSEVASRIWETLPLPAEIDAIRDIAAQIAGASSKAAKKKAQGLVTKALEDVEFFDTSVGKWLLAAAMNKPLELLASGVESEEFQELQKVAATTVAVLDGSALEGALARLHAYVSEKLRVDVLRDLNERKFDDLDGWMKAKLSQFIGGKIDFSKVDEVRKAINLLDGRAQDFYDKALEALNRQYEFSFAYRFQSSTTKTALIDVSLDFAEGNVAPTLRRVLAGDFDALLTRRTAGVHLHLGTLTHGIERQASINVTLPWVKNDKVSRSEALAELNAIDEDDGRLLVYSVDATNSVTEVTTRGDAQSYRSSTLAVAARLPVKSNQVKVHSEQTLTTSYTYVVAQPQMKFEDLLGHFGPYVSAYFPRQFGSADAPRFAVWAAVLDRRIDDDPETANGPLVFGDTLAKLQVVLPDKIGGAWFTGPTRATAPVYLKMSLHIQAKLRELMAFHYFSDADNFTSVLATHALLMYVASSPSNGVKINQSGELVRTDRSIHWDWKDPDVLSLMMRRAGTTTRLEAQLAEVRARLGRVDRIAGFASHYQSARQVRQTLKSGNARTLLKKLYRMESIATRRAVGAAVEGAKFAQKQDTRPTEALESLAKFGVDVTTAFNNDLSPTYGKAALRPLGTLVYLEALRGLDPSIDETAAPLATFQIDVLRKGETLPGTEQRKELERSLLAIRERIVNV